MTEIKITPSNSRHPSHGVCRCPFCYDQFGYETPFDEKEIMRLARLGAAVEANKACCPGRYKCDDCDHLPSGKSALEPCTCRMCKATIGEGKS